MGDGVVPVFVVSPGRTGTTLLLETLRTSPEILCPGGYPNEDRYLSFFLAVARMLERPDAGSQLSEALAGAPERQEASAFAMLRDRSIDLDLIDDQFPVRVVQALWAAFAASLPENFKYYVEKTVGPKLLPLMDQLDHRLIYMVRDPRDTLVSVREFNRKRGFDSFGWSESEDDLAYAEKMIGMYRQFLRAAASITEGDAAAIVVRYEDMVGRPELAIAKLEAWLDVDLSREVVSRPSQHMTSSDVSASVERWRSELSNEVTSFFEQEIKDELVAVGYPAGD